MFTGKELKFESQCALENLLALLKKLGIREADRVWANVSVGSMLNIAMRNFGTPNQMYMDPHTYAALSKSLKSDPKLTKKNNKP